MKRVVLAALLSLALLSGCGDDAPPEKETISWEDRLEKRYHYCIEHGGSWKYHANSSSWDCLKPHAVWRG